MTNEEYKVLINKNKPKEPRLKNAIISFLTGGFLGFLCEVISFLLINCFNISKVDSYSIICLLLIVGTSLLTCLNIFDDLIQKFKCGLIIPTTGFAHSITATALDYKKEGLITGMGSNFFKLAGSVILYGIISAFLLVILKVIIYG